MTSRLIINNGKKQPVFYTLNDQKSRYSKICFPTQCDNKMRSRGDEKKYNMQINSRFKTYIFLYSQTDNIHGTRSHRFRFNRKP